MARKVNNKKGFLVIELTKSEAIKKCMFGIDNNIICDGCNRLPYTNEFVYYIAVLNMVFCKHCYEEWYNRSNYCQEDRAYEVGHYNIVAKALELELEK